MTTSFRTERDSMGELQVPADALWGAQTQRAVQNFPISGLPLPREFIAALGLIKQAAARANRSSACSSADVARGHRRGGGGGRGRQARRAVPDRRVPDRLGHQLEHECQRGHRAARDRSASGKPVHANDHVNMGQSSNDVIPTAIHVSAAIAVRQHLVPALEHARDVLASEGAGGRRHREDRPHASDGCDAGDARPGAVGLAHAGRERHRAPARACEPRLLALAQGGTAVGTGINAHPEFGARFAQELAQAHRACRSPPSANYFESHVHAGCGGGALRPAEDDRRQPDEDRQRPALDEQRAARGARRDRAAGAAAGQQHHAGQGQSGDSRRRRPWSRRRSSATTPRSRSPASPATSS